MSKRPLCKGDLFFADAQKGDDANAGTASSPWQSITHALTRLKPGSTLVLRGGTFYENVCCNIKGTESAPITIRAYPGERVYLDGGISQFQLAPDTAWEPVPDGAPDEFVSTQSYPGLGFAVGMFADSRIGLSSYKLAGDFRATNELRHEHPNEDQQSAWSVYAGPGLWYDEGSGRIHVRLSHTHLPAPVAPGNRFANYQGETDPRRLPLVIAGSQSVPLLIDNADHVRFCDITVRGGGRNTVVLQNSRHIELDGLTVLCGSFRGADAGPVRITNSGFFGRYPPWIFRADASCGCYNGPRYRDLVYPVTARGFDTSSPPLDIKPASDEMHAPHNHDWEISYCEFTDGHDGLFLAGKGMRFHHNLIDNFQDDGLDVSTGIPTLVTDTQIYQNLFRCTLMALASHNYGPKNQAPRGRVCVYRNIIDLRQETLWSRPSPKNPNGSTRRAVAYFMHGSNRAEHVESMYFYQNTVIAPSRGAYSFAHAFLYHLKKGAVRRAFNNIFVYIQSEKRLKPWHGFNPAGMDLQFDANLHWYPDIKTPPPPGYFSDIHDSRFSKENLKRYPVGFASCSRFGDPKFRAYSSIPTVANDYRLKPDSPAVKAGIVLPADYHDPLRSADNAKPDIGAIPLDGRQLRVGINSRIAAGTD